MPLGPAGAEDARVAVVDLEREDVERGAVDAATADSPAIDVDRVPRAVEAAVGAPALVVAERVGHALVPRRPRGAARPVVLVERERAGVPVVEIAGRMRAVGIPAR